MVISVMAANYEYRSSITDGEYGCLNLKLLFEIGIKRGN